jgi:ABC-type polar amino acid transport system ATPase subunit
MDEGRIIEEGTPPHCSNNPKHERSRTFLRRVTERDGTNRERNAI